MADLFQPAGVLVTGAAGFIASHVTNALVRSFPGVHVTAIDRLDPCATRENISQAASSPLFTLVEADITAPGLLDSVLDATPSIDCILHFAARSHVDDSFDHPQLYVQDNISGTLAVLEAARRRSHRIQYLTVHSIVPIL